MNKTTNSTDSHSSPELQPETTTLSGWSRVKRFFLFLFNLTLALLILVGGVFLINARAVATADVASTAKVTVETITIERSGSYEVEHQFVGLVESLQEIDVAFEAGGTVASVPVTEGETVKQGSVLATIDRRAISAQKQQILAAHKAAVVSLQRADLALKRERKLGGSGYGSKQNLDNSRLEVEQTSASLVEMDARLRSADIALAKGVLRAPFDAVVGERLVEAGSVVESGRPILRLFEQGNPTARIGIPADLRIDWQAQEDSRLTVNGQEFSGRFVGKRPDVAVDTRVIETRFELLGGDGSWTAVGQVARLHWLETRQTPGYWIPIGALSEGKRGLWSVFRLIDEDSAAVDSQTDLATVVREHVEVIHTDGDRAYVQGSLPETFKIVYNGVHRVVPEQRVQVAHYSK